MNAPSRREEVEAQVHTALSLTLADEVDERDAVITKLLAMLEPGRGVFGTHVDDSTVSLSVDDWNLMERIHARACEIAGRKE